MKRYLSCLVAVVAVLAVLLPATNAEAKTQTIDVQIPKDGLWTAFLVGFDTSKIRSVAYYWQDAKEKWRHTQPEFVPPFSTPIPWWEGDNNGYEAVTAHVSLLSGKEIKDPGGWHWVDGHHANPKGSLSASSNGDTYSAKYSPDAEASQIGGVEFWVKEEFGSWYDAGPAQSTSDGAWSSDSLLGAGGKPFKSTAEAVSVHVIWPNGTQWVDPTAWATTFPSNASAETQPSIPVLPAVRPASVAEPNHSFTPGQALPGVTTAQICTAGWASAHRHVVAEQYRAVYAEYGIAYPEPAGSYELDHLIPLELGGTNDDSNLWPEPADPTPGFHQKDVLENHLHQLVCSGQLDLATAQQAVAGDWYAAYLKYVNPAPVVAATTPAPKPPTTAPQPAPPPPVQAPPPAALSVSITASSYGYVAAHTIPGAVCSAQARLPSGRISTAQGLQVQATAGGDGNVAWSYGTTTRTNPGTGTHTVSCSLNGQSASTSAAFTV